MPARVVHYRFAFDPTGPCIRRAVGLGEDGTRVAETSFDEVRRTPDGQAVPLRAVTQVAAGTEIWRVAMGDGQVGETKMPRPAYTVTTEYEWSEEEQVRFPKTRTIGAADGAALGEIRFSNYEVLNEP